MELDNTVHVFDDLFTPVEIEHVFKQMTHPGFPWYFGATLGQTVSSAAYRELADEHTYEQFQLTRWLMRQGQWTTNEYSDDMKTIIGRIARRLGLESLALDRIKANLQTRTLTELRYNTPHVDNQQARYFVAIYYVNDADGRTYIFRNTEKPLKILKEIRSKAGRVAVFDGRFMHAGSHPRRSDFRIVINFNFMV
jgi:hypothetical protein